MSMTQVPETGALNRLQESGIRSSIEQIWY